jgi:hypothetical protein
MLDTHAECVLGNESILFVSLINLSVRHIEFEARTTSGNDP